MTSLKELIEQKRQLNALIETARQKETKAALEQALQMIAEFGFTDEQLFPVGGNIKIRKKVAAKYRDPETGKTWTGRGITPKWLEGKNLAQYEIGDESADETPQLRLNIDPSNPFPVQ